MTHLMGRLNLAIAATSSNEGPEVAPTLIRGRFMSVTDYLVDPTGEPPARAHTMNALKVQWPTSRRIVS
jgi:hypothetical protein